ncbi:DNA mismatch repair protein MutT [Bacillus coahuilensis m2-6]|uniref:DNA mismatch repair protein MutT n=1 Tax=Bacillus coahuilensis p1.1.43 TaxID=1150625 RepID=A0A147KC32_9BACI|nr:hypothetical protein [Bacillus coahuilensis]KUP09117.1 DNA mismatch repair protein MutT [Bacillus coahuilensis p1.1.43]KUP09832.1 DNA mismatch repair protein MutT [Bacillus coahuilensis m2-6]
MNSNQKNRTIAGTDIDEVKRLNNQSGLTYNQVVEKMERELKEKGNAR